MELIYDEDFLYYICKIAYGITLGVALGVWYEGYSGVKYYNRKYYGKLRKAFFLSIPFTYILMGVFLLCIDMTYKNCEGGVFYEFAKNMVETQDVTITGYVMRNGVFMTVVCTICNLVLIGRSWLFGNGIGVLIKEKALLLESKDK